MKTKRISLQWLLLLAGATAILAGCETTSPVGEAPAVRPWRGPHRVTINTGTEGVYYNPMTRNFERPWPYGPYQTVNWR